MSTNDITGDKMISKASNEKFRNGYDLLFGAKKRPADRQVETEKSEEILHNNPVEENPLEK